MSNPKLIGEISVIFPTGKSGFQHWSVSEYGEELPTGGGVVSAGAGIPWGGTYSLIGKINFSRSDYLENFGNVSVSGALGYGKTFEVKRIVPGDNAGYRLPYEFRYKPAPGVIDFTIAVEYSLLLRGSISSVGFWIYGLQTIGNAQTYTNVGGLGWRPINMSINMLMLGPSLKIATFKGLSFKLISPVTISGKNSYKNTGIWLSVNYGTFLE